MVRVLFPDGSTKEGTLRKICEEVGYGYIRHRLSKEGFVEKDGIKI